MAKKNPNTGQYWNTGPLIGIQQLNPDISEEEFADLYLLFYKQINTSQR